MEFPAHDIDQTEPHDLDYVPEPQDVTDDIEQVLDQAIDDTGEDSPAGGDAVDDTLDDAGDGVTTATEAEPIALGDPPDAIAFDTETCVQCPQCQSKASWRGLLDIATSTVFTRGANAITGMPNCPHCGTAMLRTEPISVTEALQQVAQALDTERAGNAARPMYQPAIPGILPAFDFRSATLTTESLERNIQDAESAWDEAKKEASDRKREFDAAVESLRKHIQTVHRARVDSEYQQAHRDQDSAATAGIKPACLFERRTGQPCAICRAENAAAPVSIEEPVHLAAALAGAAIVDATPAAAIAEEFRVALSDIAGIAVDVETLSAWTKDDRVTVANWLQAFAGDAASNEEPWARPIPLVLGKFHEAAEASGEQQACRICGAALKRFGVADGAPVDGAALETWPVGQKVGTDCAGEPIADVARTPSRRHASRRDAAKAKQAAATEASEAPAPDDDQPQTTTPAAGARTPRAPKKAAPKKAGARRKK